MSASANGSGAAKFGARFPLPDVTWAPAAPFYATAAAGELQLPFCNACGRVSWYPKKTCIWCPGDTFTWRMLPGTGTVFSFVVVRHTFLPQYADLIPFVTALVSVDDAPGARLTSRLVDVDPEAVHIDMRVEAVFTPLRFAGVDGEVVAPLFRPARG